MKFLPCYKNFLTNIAAPSLVYVEQISFYTVTQNVLNYKSVPLFQLLNLLTQCSRAV